MQKYTYIEVKTAFESVGCVLLSEKYQDANQPLDYKCSCGETHRTRWSNFNKGIRHGYCKDGQHHRLIPDAKYLKTYTRAEVSVMMKVQGLELVAYNGLGSKMYLKCACGEEFFKTVEKETIFAIHMCSTCFKLASDEKLLVNKNRGLESQLWSWAVRGKDKFTCQACGNKDKDNLHAHHVKSWKDYPELRFDVTNGITYCGTCHSTEHVRLRKEGLE